MYKYDPPPHTLIPATAYPRVESASPPVGGSIRRMAKRDNDPSEFERVARAGWMVTLRYYLLLTQRPSRQGAKWRWVAAGSLGSTAIAVVGALNKLGWFS